MEEQNELIKRVCKHDDLAFAEILAKNEKLIYAIINEFDLEFGDYKVSRDDLYQEGCIALYNACLGYHYDSLAKFSTFAYTCIKRRINRVYRKALNRYYEERYSFDKYVISDRLEQAAIVAEKPLNYRKNDDFMSILNKMSYEDRMIVKLRMEHYSYEEIAKQLNINKKHIDNRLYRLRKRYLKK